MWPSLRMQDKGHSSDTCSGWAGHTVSEGAYVRHDRVSGRGVCEDDFHSSQKLLATSDRNSRVI